MNAEWKYHGVACQCEVNCWQNIASWENAGWENTFFRHSAVDVDRWLWMSTSVMVPNNLYKVTYNLLYLYTRILYYLPIH